MSEPQAVWLYAVAAGTPGAGLDGLRGVAGGPVRAVEADGLTAVAGDVPLAEFGEAPLRRHLEDLAWLEDVARAHHAVIETVGRESPVVPMRLATVYRDDAGVTAALVERGNDFHAALGRIAARTEWGVKAYASRPAGDGGPASAQAAPESGTAYLRRRRQELSAQADSRHEASASADAIHGRLCGLAVAARLHPPQAPQLSGRDEQMLLNAAYLLDESRGEEFAAAVSALARQHPAVRAEVTGPWPPYSFASLPPGPDGS